MRVRQFLYLLYQTTRASFLAQEKNSSLGLIWHLLNPVLMTAVLFMVFRNVQSLKEIEHYELFILVGLIHYNFFINTTTRASQNFLLSRSLVLNTTVPLELLVLRSTCLEALTLLFEILLVVVLGFFMGAKPGAAVVLYPLVFAGLVAISLGASLALCALVVFLSDLNYVWGLFCRLLFFITPVFFLPAVAGEGLARTIIELNPLTGLIALARTSLLYGGHIAPSQAALGLVGPCMVLILGWAIFKAIRPRIPDYI